MEDMPASVSVSLNLSSSVCDGSGISSSTEITRFKLVTDAASFLSVSSNNVISSDINCVVNTGSVIVALNGDAIMTQEEDEVLSIGDDTNLSIAEEELLALEATTTTTTTILALSNPKTDPILAQTIILEDSISSAPQDGVLTSGTASATASATAIVIAQLPPKEKHVGKTGIKSVFEIDCVPLWGSVSLCGKRPEMEDAVSAMPRFLKIPIKMLIADRPLDGISQSLTHVTSHFYAVYDGHGGSQVANYCRDRVHYALAEEIELAKCEFADENIGKRRQVQWEKTFTDCFQRVDDEIGGKVSRGTTNAHGEEYSSSSLTCSGPVAPETVGSTAVVALVCSSHIIVANCGDSRAVLLRGKESMALSIDHKPDTKSEYNRIEAAGGKVIQWNGYRVFGVLAMSRSIGDRYLKPWIIPEPEVMFIPRARDDECLVIASDGLWDVMTNEEVCEVARKRILLWHKKNGNSPSLMAERGQGIDPAAQSAAGFLAMLAMDNKGSKDNISVIVVDLKAQRKFKTKS